MARPFSFPAFCWLALAMVTFLLPARAQETMGIAKIVSDPPGALVTIDDEAVGEAPLTRYVPVGRHIVRVTMDRYDPFVRRIDVALDTTLEVRADLTPGGGTIEFVANPVGAKVVLNETEEWPTPVRLNRAPGHYTYRIEAEGHETKEGSFDFAEGQNLLINAKLRSADGLITFKSEPSGARVRLGDDVMGTTPLTLDTVPKGAHTFLLDLPGHALVPQDVDTSDGGGAKIEAFLPDEGIEVSVTTDIPHASLLIEGVPVGSGEVVTFRAAERVPYHLEVRAQGYAPGVTTLVIDDKTKVLFKTAWQTDGDGHTSTIKRVRPLTSQWTFWTATGAGVALVAGGTLVALTGGSNPDDSVSDAQVVFP